MVGFDGRIVFDVTRPDGTPRKLLDVSKLHDMGWRHTVALREGLERTYADFLRTHAASEPERRKAGLRA